MSNVISLPVQTMGERIRRCRTERGWEPFHLAVRLGITRAAVQAWEGDVSGPSISTMPRLAEALGVDPHWLEFGNDKNAAAEPRTNFQVDTVYR